MGQRQKSIVLKLTAKKLAQEAAGKSSKAIQENLSREEYSLELLRTLYRIVQHK
jgi:hypothetical protein